MPLLATLIGPTGQACHAEKIVPFHRSFADVHDSMMVEQAPTGVWTRRP